MRKALVVYESMWGNTEQVAKAIAAGLQQSMQVQFLDVADAPPQPASDIELVVVGGPTHAFSMSRESTRESALERGAPRGHRETGVREWLDAQPAEHHAQRLATFDTRVDKVRHLPGSAAKSAAKAGHRHGFPRAVAVESFYVEDMEGPLVDGEEERATAWGRDLGTNLARHTS